MALLDFLKNRRSEQQQPVANKPQQKPEIAKERYTRQAAEQPLEKSLAGVPPEVQARIDTVRATLERASRHVNKDAPAAAAQGGTAGSEKLARAMRYVDASTRPKLPTAPQVRWPRPPASWER